MKEGKLRKSRSAARGWMTHSSNALMDLLGDREVSKVELQDAVDDFDRRIAHLDEVQSALELEIGDPQDLEEDIEYADKFRRQIRPRPLLFTFKIPQDAEPSLGETTQSDASLQPEEAHHRRLIFLFTLDRLQLPEYPDLLQEICNEQVQIRL